MKNQEKNTTILETLEGLESQNDSVIAIIKQAIQAVKEAEESAAKTAAIAALAAVLNVSIAELSSLDDDQISTLTAIPDGQKKAVYSAFVAANAAINTVKKAEKAEKKAKKITLQTGQSVLSAFEFLNYNWEGHVPFSRIVAETIRRFKCNISRTKTIEQIEKYEASFRASYLSEEYVAKLAEFVGRERFIDNRNIVEATLDEAVDQAKQELLKLVP